MDPDRALIERAQAGDASAFRQIFVSHRNDVARVVFRMIGPSADIEDVVQEVFLHVYRSLKSFRGESRFSTWLYRLAVNVTRMHLRSARSRPRLALAVAPEEPIDGITADSPDVVMERQDRVRALYRLLESLSEKKREVLVMHDFDGVTAKEIAEILAIPVLTVRTRLFYARKELYAAMAEEPHLRAAVESLREEQERKPTPSQKAPLRPRIDELQEDPR
jgi:RNA polymerase sigma-70 factor (ECF subfamily)